jgi:hypothetical protein
MCWYCNMAMFHSYVLFPWMKRKGSYMFSVKSVHWTGGKVSRVQFRFTSSLWNRLEHGTGQESCWGSISKNQMFIICCLMFVDELPIARMDVLFFRYRYPNDLTRRILKPYEVGPRHLYILMCIYIYYILILIIIILILLIIISIMIYAWKDRYAHDNLYPPIVSAIIFGETHRFSFCG